MIRLIVGIACAVWLLSALISFGIACLEKRNSPTYNINDKREIHDGSNLAAGAIVSLMLGPIGLAFWAIGYMDKENGADKE